MESSLTAEKVKLEYELPSTSTKKINHVGRSGLCGWEQQLYSSSRQLKIKTWKSWETALHAVHDLSDDSCLSTKNVYQQLKLTVAYSWEATS